MDILLLLIPLSVLVALFIAGLFWWSAANGQFDDLEGPAYRILVDDDSSVASASDLTSINPRGDEAP